MAQDTEEKLKDTDTQLQELREACLSDTDGELHPDCACCKQLDTLSRDCAELRQQVLHMLWVLSSDYSLQSELQSQRFPAYYMSMI